MIFSKQKRILSAFLSLTMIGTVVASVPFTASAAATPNVAFSVFENNTWKASKKGVAGQANKKFKVSAVKAAKGSSLVVSIYENKKWISAANGKVAGSAAKKTKAFAEAFKATLKKASGYTVSYSVFENKKWVSAKNGAVAGKTGKKLAIEAIKISVTKNKKPTPPKETPTVSSVASVADVIVPVGTSSTDAIAKLPTTVDVTLSDGTTKSGVAATWAAPTNYDPKTDGSYAFTGTLAAIDGVDNSANVTATANVIVGDPTIAKVVPTNDNLGIGGTTSFQFENAAGTVLPTPSGVTYALEDATAGTIDASGKLTVSKSGAIKVDVTNGSTKYVATVNVYGAAVGVAFSTSADVVANEASAETVTIQAVDANNIPVANFNGNAAIAITGSGAEYFASTTVNPTYLTSGYAAPTTITFTNGKATLTAIGGAIGGVADQLKVTSMLATGAASTTTIANPVGQNGTVTTVAQKATSIKVTAAPTVTVNSAVTTPVTVEVQDQAGKKMISGGIFGLTVKIAGAAKYADGTTADKTIAYYGAPSSPDPIVNLTSVQGVTGATTVTVSGTNLTSGTATINSAVAGAAAKLTVANTDGSANTFVTNNSDTYTLSTVDANKVPTGNFAGTAKVFVYKADGTTVATNIKVSTGTSTTGAAAEPADGSGVALAAGATNFTISDTAANADVGAYKVVVKDSAGSLAAADTFDLNVTADVAYKTALSVANNYVAAATPTTTVKAQVTDQYGNPVAAAGVPVAFSATSANTTAKATFNAGTYNNPLSATVNTDATGLATATFTAQSYTATWSITATAGSYAASAASTVTVASQPVAALGIAVSAASNSSTIANSGEVIKVTVSQKDSYGNAIDPATAGNENDSVTVKLSNAGAINWPSVGSTGATIDSVAGTISGTVLQVNAYLSQPTLKAVAAGAVTFTVTDTSITTATPATAGITVVAGTAIAGFHFYNATTGADITTTGIAVATGNTAVPVVIKPVDAAGNPIIANSDYTVTLSAPSGSFSTVLNGQATSTFTFGNGAPSQTIYYNNANAGTYVATAGFAVKTGVSGSFAITSTGITTVPAVPAITAVPGVYTVTLSDAGFAANDTITIDGITTTLDASSSASGTAAATAIKTAMASDANYTVTSTGAVVTLTQKAGKESPTAPTFAKVIAGAGTATFATSTPGITGAAGVAGVTGATEVGTLTVSSGATYGGNINVTIGTTVYTVAVSANDSAIVVAGKIATAINTAGVPTGYTVANPTSTPTVTFTYTANTAVGTHLTGSIA